MIRLFFSFLFISLLAVLAAGQVPQQFIWKITFVADSVGESRVSVQNRCRNTHDFRISGRNVPFLDFARDELTIRGGGTENVPVSVDTAKLTRSSYQGQVTLFCLTCAKESGCSQSRDILNVTLNIVTKEQLANYRPSKEIGIDSPIAISASSIAAGSNAVSENEVRKLLEDLAGSPSAESRPGVAPIAACGIPQVRAESSLPDADCKGECSTKQRVLRELETKVRRQTSEAEKLCLGLMQLENTTAFVEAKARRAERQLVNATDSGSDERVLDNLRSEAVNSKKDARVFRDRVGIARDIVDRAKEEAFSAQQELDDAVVDFQACLRKNPSGCK
ncbi:MAG: hypothetical protein DWQ47_15100 [Acidobacteria bacterium]|nr:MAG: hypothetical protein DWQ32_02500 [Acidobacteriota bacterium]REK02609.1 MAG: hypothetical protein DWQ38_09635 [Acidobacteriota bacterium]REK13588.1 MAG: hypothetical protein DWQ43_08190 [Acidobacteriota bacterium]REK41582.1 MAG: hypothetical protein DWQ47_15100 [Acidobacteriota bacterium]